MCSTKSVCGSKTRDLEYPVEVDLLTLIDEIVVGPKAQPWILELAHTVVQRYDLDLAVRSSELMAPVRERE